MYLILKTHRKDWCLNLCGMYFCAISKFLLYLDCVCIDDVNQVSMNLSQIFRVMAKFNYSTSSFCENSLTWNDQPAEHSDVSLFQRQTYYIYNNLCDLALLWFDGVYHV